MSLVMIKEIKQNGYLAGYKIYDTDKFYSKDIPIDSLIQGISNGKIVHGLMLVDGKLGVSEVNRFPGSSVQYDWYGYNEAKIFGVAEEIARYIHNPLNSIFIAHAAIRKGSTHLYCVTFYNKEYNIYECGIITQAHINKIGKLLDSKGYDPRYTDVSLLRWEFFYTDFNNEGQTHAKDFGEYLYEIAKYLPDKSEKDLYSKAYSELHSYVRGRFINERNFHNGFSSSSEWFNVQTVSYGERLDGVVITYGCGSIDSGVFGSKRLVNGCYFFIPTQQLDSSIISSLKSCLILHNGGRVILSNTTMQEISRSSEVQEVICSDTKFLKVLLKGIKYKLQSIRI